ncbi:response regulator [Iodobacter fluviatilis]|uniref:CheY-like chemotaxis protein n=1 Tax=Iodobacter fluviatilis TaxID=537 RepID=A0A377Q140_9NEIS|nr:response regulator [Iodobacter fluviatilis]TCU80297.1 CheY-like chemotaxis protein [Iodobacter fluviatilis]STQ88996.1 Chemotaxis protein CheY [Iodobacter fluviatilis]
MAEKISAFSVISSATAKRKAANGIPDVASLRVLIIDPLAEVRRSIGMILGQYGTSHIDHASNSTEALASMKKLKYELILCEYDLGKGQDGLFLFDEARRLDLLKASSIFIITTAERQAQKVLGAAEQSPDAILLKPFTGEMLYSRVLSALQKKVRFKLVDEAIMAHDFLSAIQLCSKAANTSAEYTQDFLRLKIHLLLRIGDWVSVRDQCRQLLVEQELPWAKMALGKALYQLKNYPEALAVFKAIISAHKHALEAYDWLARAQQAIGEDNAAQETLKRAIHKSPFVVNRQRQLGEAALKSGDLATAENALLETVKISRHSFLRNPADYGQLADVQISRGDVAAARLTVEEIRKDFKDPQVSVLADALDADIYMHQGDVEKAQNQLRTALGQLVQLTLPPSAMVGMALAKACFNQKQEALAEIVVRNLLKNSHDDLSLASKITTLYRQHGHQDQAEQLIKENSASIVALNNEAVKMARSGDLAGAAELFIRAATDMPGNIQVLLNTVNALLAYTNQHGWHQEWMQLSNDYLLRIHDLDPSNGRGLQLQEFFRKTKQRYGISE